MYRTALLKKHGIRFSEKVFYDDMEYDIYPLPYVKTVLPIDRYFYMYRLEREGQSVEDAGFIRHRKHRYTIVLNLCRYFKEMKDRFGKNVYNHLYPDMVWKADRQYDIYFLSEDDEIAAQEMADFDRALKETNEEIYNDIKNEAVLKYRRGASYAQAKKIFLATKERVESRGKRPKAWTLESDPEMHEMIARRVRLKKFHLDKRDKEMQKIAALKDSEKGKRCFITCTGPSLKIEDLELLKDEITIGVNSVVKAYDKTDWRPTYYAMVDYYAFGEFLKNTDLPGKKLCEKNAFLHYRVDPKNKTGKEIYCLINYANHFENRLTAKDILFSDDLSVCAYDAFTVTNFAIQVAMYLGFKEIYIIGADCNYSGSQIHFIEMPDDHVKMAAGWLPDALALSIEGYKAIKKYAEERGVKIFNSTRGGMLEVFPRKSIEEVLKNRG